MLKQNGWTLVRIRGSHHVITHPNYPKTVTVPHPKNDLPIGTVKQIAKNAHTKL